MGETTMFSRRFCLKWIIFHFKTSPKPHKLTLSSVRDPQEPEARHWLPVSYRSRAADILYGSLDATQKDKPRAVRVYMGTGRAWLMILDRRLKPVVRISFFVAPIPYVFSSYWNQPRCMSISARSRRLVQSLLVGDVQL